MVDDLEKTLLKNKI